MGIAADYLHHIRQSAPFLGAFEYAITLRARISTEVRDRTGRGVVGSRYFYWTVLRGQVKYRESRLGGTGPRLSGPVVYRKRQRIPCKRDGGVEDR